MASIRLTAAAVEKLICPTTGRREVYDAEVPGLVLRLSSSGVKSWSFTYRIAGKPRRLTLGGYPGVSLKLARDRARDARAAVQRGEDPVEDIKREQREKELNGFEACAKDFIKKYCKPKLKTWEQVESTLERLAIPEFKDRPVRDIRRRDIVDLLEKVAAKTPGQSNHLRAYLSKMFNWLLEREAVEVNPVVGIAQRYKPQARTRILTDDEVKALWKATERMGGAFGACTQFLLTTGVRRDEAGLLRWDELDGPWARLAASRMKAGRDFKAPLSSAALAILGARPRFAGCPYVFTTGGKVPINGWGKAKETLDKYMAEAHGAPVPDWRLHDLRRTVASGLARLGYGTEVIKRVLAHTPPASDVTSSVYNQYAYDAEAMAAVQAWGAHVTALVAGKEGGPAGEGAEVPAYTPPQPLVTAPYPANGAFPSLPYSPAPETPLNRR